MGGERRLAPADDRGQTAVEFITVLGLVGLVIAVLAASSIVTLARTATRTAVCDTLSQGPCAAVPPEPAAPAAETGRPATALDQTYEAFLNGATYGDFNRTGYTNPWHETARAAGHLASGLLIYGDLRDATAALSRLRHSNGHEGWSDLTWSTLGLIPIAGDLARTTRTLDHLADVRRAAGHADDAHRPLSDSVGAARSLRYEASPKHGPAQRGRAAPGPVNGQSALDVSVQVKATSPRRVGIDYESEQFVVFDETHPGSDIYHSHVRPWGGRDGLGMEMQNALVRAGLVTRRGRIIDGDP